tara:strand:- start:931 stop:1980 length:1050 start_codon:yes stop_codon:yes gene_type:complete
MLTLTTTITGIILIVFLIKFYKEYKLEDKLPLLFIIPILLIIYNIISTILYALKLIPALKLHLILIFLLIIFPVIYFLSLRYFTSKRLFIRFRSHTQLYLKSIRQLKKNFLYNSILGFCLAITASVIILLLGLFLRNNFSFMLETFSVLKDSKVNQTIANQQVIMALSQNADKLKSALTSSIIGLIIALTILLLTISIFRGLIWSNILKQKYNKLFFRRFTLLSLLWYLLTIALIAISIIIFRTKVGISIAVILLLLSMYLKLIINLRFNKSKTILKNIKQGFKRTHLFTPFTFAFTSLVLLFTLLSLFSPGFEDRAYIFLQVILTLTILTFFVNWARLYLAKVYNFNS